MTLLSEQVRADPQPAQAVEPLAGKHFAALDGIRAVAVIAVLLFHAGVGWFSGGMLGVDMFFALSGFLITSLLVNEHAASGTLRLGRFYGRRARRLVPALLIALVIVAVYAAWFAESDLLGSIRGDALATLAYVSNWHFIISDQGYFVHFGAPSPLLHTWSLAVEEQFYLVWPLVALFVLRRHGPRVLAAVAATGAVASMLLTMVLYSAGESANRLYYGSDTRAQAVMVGACLGALASRDGWLVTRPPWTRRRSSRRFFAGAGLLGAAGCLWGIHHVSSSDPLLYRGGFAFMALATTAVIMAVVVEPRALLARALSWGPLCYVGRISYGLYLYHWPMFLVLDSARTGLVGWRLLAVRLASTFGVAVCSYHLVERPIRERRFLRGWQLTSALAVAVVAIVIALVASTVTPVAAGATNRGLSVPTPAQRAVLMHNNGLAPGNPVRVLILGDSLALTLSMGLGADAQAWDVQVVNESVLGCDLDPSSIVNVGNGSGRAAPGCVGWQQTWAGHIQKYHPDVVLVELGRWEVSDRIVNGHWTRIGQPTWDDLLSRLLDQAIGVLTRRGAKVVLCTLPYIQQTTEQPNGQPWPVNEPLRTDQYNAVVRNVAANHQDVSVIDLNRLLDPMGHYTSYVDGVRVRDSDNEHPSVAGGELLRPVILPQLVALGASHDRHR